MHSLSLVAQDGATPSLIRTRGEETHRCDPRVDLRAEGFRPPCSPETMPRSRALTDRIDARPLTASKGAIRFENVRFHYGKAGGVIATGARILRSCQASPLLPFAVNAPIISKRGATARS